MRIPTALTGARGALLLLALGASCALFADETKLPYQRDMDEARLAELIAQWPEDARWCERAKQDASNSTETQSAERCAGKSWYQFGWVNEGTHWYALALGGGHAAEIQARGELERLYPAETRDNQRAAALGTLGERPLRELYSYCDAQYYQGVDGGATDGDAAYTRVFEQQRDLRVPETQLAARERQYSDALEAWVKQSHPRLNLLLTGCWSFFDKQAAIEDRASAMRAWARDHHGMDSVHSVDYSPP